MMACLDYTAAADVEALCQALSFLSNAVASFEEAATPHLSSAIRECDLGPIACYLATTATMQERRTFGRLFAKLVEGYEPVRFSRPAREPRGSPPSSASKLQKATSVKRILTSSTSRVLKTADGAAGDVGAAKLKNHTARAFGALVSAASNSANGNGANGNCANGADYGTTQSTPGRGLTGTVVIRLRSTLFAHGHLSDFESAPLRASILGFLHSHVLDSKALELTLDLRFPPSEDLLLHVMISGKDVDGAWLARQLEAAFCAKKWTRIFGSRYGSLGALCTVCFSPCIADAERIVCGLCAGTCTPSSRSTAITTRRSPQTSPRPSDRSRHRLRRSARYGSRHLMPVGRNPLLRPPPRRSTSAWQASKMR